MAQDCFSGSTGSSGTPGSFHPSTSPCAMVFLFSCPWPPLPRVADTDSKYHVQYFYASNQSRKWGWRVGNRMISLFTSLLIGSRKFWILIAKEMLFKCENWRGSESFGAICGRVSWDSVFPCPFPTPFPIVLSQNHRLRRTLFSPSFFQPRIHSWA